MEFLSDEWIAALDAAARARVAPDDDPLSEVTFTLEQVVDGDGSWRMVIDRGTVTVRRSAADDPPADVRILCSEAVARALAARQRPALDAFIAGDLRIGGNVAALLEHRSALEALGDLFASIG